MKKSLVNNLFNYATSELSQDAFICWLASYALENAEKDIAIQNCAKDLMMLFLPELKDKEFKLLKIEKQVKNIDVLLTLSCGSVCYKVIVEDKTYTSQHSSQLQRYKKSICEKGGNFIVKGIYFKTWYQADLSEVYEAGYDVVLREDVIEVMSKYYDQTNNRIFRDYYDYLRTLQLECLDYKVLPTNEWNYKQIFAFYDYLKETLFKNRDMFVGYEYVSNKQGGFDGLWTGLRGKSKINIDGVKCELYLQIHATMLEDGCEVFVSLRLSILEKVSSELISGLRNKIVYGSNSCDYRLGEYDFEKPSRLGHGQSMKIGVFKGEPKVFASYKDFEKDIVSAIDGYERLLLDLS